MLKLGQNEVDAGSFQVPLMSGGRAAGGVRPPHEELVMISGHTVENSPTNPTDEEFVMISRCLRPSSNIALFTEQLQSPDTIQCNTQIYFQLF